MSEFQDRVNQLRSYESISYTICLYLLVNEEDAAQAAEQLLIQLFKDQHFWQMEEQARQHYLLRNARDQCFNHKLKPSLVKSS